MIIFSPQGGVFVLVAGNGFEGKPRVVEALGVQQIEFSGTFLSLKYG